MAFTITALGQSSGTATSYTTGAFTCGAKDLLVAAVTVGNNDAAFLISGVTDSAGGTWTELDRGSASVFDSIWWYKEANGSETTVTISFAGSYAYDAVVIKATGWVNTPTLEDKDENETFLASATTTSIGGGSVTNTTASALALMFVASDLGATMDGSRSVSDGSTYTERATSGSQIFLSSHEKSAPGTYSPVYSFTDTGDEAYAASAIFGDAAAGSGFQPAWARGCNALLKAA